MVKAEIKGYFAAGNDRPAPAAIAVSVTGYGASEQLTADCKGGYRVTVPLRPVERLSYELRRGGSPPELSVKLTGAGSGGKTGTATVWLRKSESFEMLTIELNSMGQISLPFAAIERLAREERGRRA